MQQKRSQRRQTPLPFAFYPKEWTTARTFDARVSLLRCTKPRGGSQLIVKKTLRIKPNSANDPKPFEMRALLLLPKCNRIVHALTCVAAEDPKHGIALFEYYPLGDLAVWKDGKFDRKNSKPVPESFIWRFFLQMSQALAFIHNEIGPGQEDRYCVLHRDIKPKNVLVADIGTTYPSFKLHDFGCASVWREDKNQQPAFSGTFEWQPPENPMINTAAAEVWALGACVHFLATGHKTIEDTEQMRAVCLARTRRYPKILEDYSSEHRYIAARVPRRVLPINLDAQTQVRRGLADKGLFKGSFRPQYSDELNDWMCRCLHFSPLERPSTTELMFDMGAEAQDLLKQMGGAAALADMEVTF